MGVSEDGIVVADGDNVRQSHVGLSAAFNMTKKSLIDAMTAAGSPELGQYTKELESFADEHPVGFKDCGKWAYQGSGPHKNAIADAALAAKKDVVMGITKKSQMTSTYKSVIDGALANGYEISAMATFVVPEELCERQVAAWCLVAAYHIYTYCTHTSQYRARSGRSWQEEGSLSTVA